MGNKFTEHDALHARCTFRRLRNRFQPQTSLWNYEKTMLIKIVALFRNLLISSFGASIRVKRAFHPALASRGFASYVFLVNVLTAAELNCELCRTFSHDFCNTVLLFRMREDKVFSNIWDIEKFGLSGATND